MKLSAALTSTKIPARLMTFSLHQLGRIVFVCLVIFFYGCASYPKEWQEYKHLFLANGRILDRGNGDISHSEGQGYGLLLALHYQDQAAFERIWSWTHNKLQVRDDHLFAWQWAKAEKESEGRQADYRITDSNNATDGDLLIAWALFQAGQQWQKSDYLASASQIADSILEQLVVPLDRQRTLLLPAHYGFQKSTQIAWNPSYQILPAYDSMAELHQNTQWENLKRTSEQLLISSLHPETKLPSDWVSVTPNQTSLLSSNMSQWPEKRNYFGDEAIRVFLYQLWQPKLLIEPYFLFEYFEQHNRLPRYVQGTKALPEKEAMAGYYAILSANARRLGKNTLADRLLLKADQRMITEKKNYYSHTLYLLAIHAAQQVTP